ncbi:MAG: hypothetical protein P8Z68_10600, partial [Kineosporiaceae bacterium]
MTTVSDLVPGDPREVGGYTLEGRLGWGGQATVYLGRAADGDPVAVKVPRADWLATAESLILLRREVDALRGVAAYATAPLLAASLDSNPPYLV